MVLGHKRSLTNDGTIRCVNITGPAHMVHVVLFVCQPHQSSLSRRNKKALMVMERAGNGSSYEGAVVAA